ncbi:MAG TPA: NAD(P)-dependent oxidoreductase [Ktedonobacteraceae bacterium]|nr:NAD(P)-dependent oxidoreductase [Ktedonobacteraceae bacterium]
MKIAIFGASGTIGQRITLEALVRGHEVIALSRSAEGFPIAHPRLRVVQVNILDPASVAQAVKDADVVVNATSGRASADVHEFYMRSTQSTIEGVKRAGGKRLIVVGGAGSLEVAPSVQLVDTPDFPAAWRLGANAQRDTLALYRASDIDWTFFSPSALIAPGRRTGNYRLGTDSLLTNDQGESYISAEDYAAALLDEIEHPQFLRKRFTAVSLEK